MWCCHLDISHPKLMQEFSSKSLTLMLLRGWKFNPMKLRVETFEKWLDWLGCWGGAPRTESWWVFRRESCIGSHVYSLTLARECPVPLQNSAARTPSPQAIPVRLFQSWTMNIHKSVMCKTSLPHVFHGSNKKLTSTLTWMLLNVSY